MNKVILLLSMLGISMSCSLKKNIETITLSHDNRCLARLDSLSNMIRHIKFGVYSVNLNVFSIEKYKDLSYLELAKEDIPFEKHHQQIYEFEKFIRIFRNDRDCLSITREILINKLGEPHSITPSRGDTNKLTYRYLFNIGKFCPNCNEPISRIFEECSHLNFYFEHNKLVNIYNGMYY